MDGSFLKYMVRTNTIILINITVPPTIEYTSPASGMYFPRSNIAGMAYPVTTNIPVNTHEIISSSLFPSSNSESIEHPPHIIGNKMARKSTKMVNKGHQLLYCIHGTRINSIPAANNMAVNI